MSGELRSVLLSGLLSVILALGATTVSWSYQAGQIRADVDQTKQTVFLMKDMAEQMKIMNENMVVMQTEMKYYRRDIDELRKKQDDISIRVNSLGDKLDP